MAHVIGVIEVLHLKCGVSVSKRKDSECDWVEEAEFNDVSDKAFNDLCHFSFVKSEGLKAEKPFSPPPMDHLTSSWVQPVVQPSFELDNVPKLSEEDLEEGEPLEVRPVQEESPNPKPAFNISVGGKSCLDYLLDFCRLSMVFCDVESVIEIEADSDSDDSESVTTEAKTKEVKCIMCGKHFRHQANLRVHIQSHLGARAQLKSCETCDRYVKSTKAI